MIKSQLQGLDSPQPILQLDNYVFQGVYEDIVGTAMIFKEEGKVWTRQ